MKEKPILLNLLSALLFLGAIFLPIQVMIYLDISFFQSFLYLSDINFLLMFSMLITSVLVFNASQYAKYSLITVLLFTLVNNVHVFKFGIYHNSLLPYLSSGFSLLIYGIFTRTKVYKVMCDKKLQWWKPAKRINVSLMATLIVNGNEYQIKTLNLSKSGIFLKTKLTQLMSEEKGNTASLKIHLPTNKIVNCHAKIVRISEDIENHPDGVALEFNQKNNFINHYIDMSLA